MPWSRFTRSNSVGAAEITDGSITAADIASAAITAPKLAAGSIVQVVEGSSTTGPSPTIRTTTYTDANLSASITPNASSNKVLAIICQTGQVYRYNNGYVIASMRLMRGSSEAVDFGGIASTQNGVGGDGSQVAAFPITLTYLDSPNTTSSVTYKTQIKLNTTANTAGFDPQGGTIRSSITLVEVRA